MGYRDTFEESGKQELVVLNMAGLFGRNGDFWRESVNVPDPLYTKVFAGNSEVSLLECAPLEHERRLDIRHRLHCLCIGYSSASIGNTEWEYKILYENSCS